MIALLNRLGLPGDEKSWAALGFDVTDGLMRVGRVDCAVGVQPGWGFDAVHADPTILGIPEVVAARSDRAADHPNGVGFVDHVVYWVPDLDEAVAGLNAVLATEPRRRFHPRGPSGPEMAFYRVGEAFIEVVAAGDQPPMLAGIAFGSADLDATVAAVRAAGGPISDPKPAVQGGRIASVWSGHVGWGVAIMEPKQRS
ncbi:VOC family protein [Nocardia sp. CDC159]|uniref:VOC family protein n=1 Tax=Nocardia pulmonis TaxID=2951408 RepID=A0A9X2EEG4_9NOCA|nr:MULTISPECIES: VOC family protein [Nocardia]MCM6778896.1 VOC family protein [Nocardia pulmonis]MCM6791785.1 VOC family protein [Nocardia sp. CDC159]